MKYQVHLVNPFGKRVQTRSYIYDISTAYAVKDEMDRLYPGMSTEIESVTNSGKLPLKEV